MNQYRRCIINIQLCHKIKAPFATSEDNIVSVVWWFNTTGNCEVMFKASIDTGQTFGNKINLSNTNNSELVDANIAVSENNVNISLWESNTTAYEPVMK